MIFHGISVGEVMTHHVVDLAGHKALEFSTVLVKTFFGTSEESTLHLPHFKITSLKGMAESSDRT